MGYYISWSCFGIWTFFGNGTSLLPKILTLTNIIFFGEKLRQIYIKKDNPLLSQVFQPKKPRARHGNKLNYLISHIVSVIAVQSGTLAFHQHFFWSNLLYFQALICSSFVIWQATGLSNVALEAQCNYLSGGLIKYRS